MNDLVVSTAISTLPALVQRAADSLANAMGSAEVLEAGERAAFAYDQAKRVARLASAKNAHDEVVAAAHRAQADALEIEARAKRRLADEYDAAQDRGEVASKGKPVNVGGSDIKPTAPELGLTRQQIHEARQIRDAEQADPGIVRRVVDEKLAAGEEPTKAAVRKAVAAVVKPAAEPEPQANVVALAPRLPAITSHEQLDLQTEAEHAAEAVLEADEVDLESVDGRAHAINGALSTLDLIEITGREYWGVFSKDPARSVYEARVRNAHRKLTDMMQEIDNVQLHGNEEPKARRQRKGTPR